MTLRRSGKPNLRGDRTPSVGGRGRRLPGKSAKPFPAYSFPALVELGRIKRRETGDEGWPFVAGLTGCLKVARNNIQNTTGRTLSSGLKSARFFCFFRPPDEAKTPIAPKSSWTWRLNVASLTARRRCCFLAGWSNLRYLCDRSHWKLLTEIGRS